MKPALNRIGPPRGPDLRARSLLDLKRFWRLFENRTRLKPTARRLSNVEIGSDHCLISRS